ncbi:hypothetical protein CMV_003267 [Castanea mollissima]|uniref:Agenet domain-containing protein n=1 Tax=Castanea mollissima TaxID=60419 RepID=A0A8J4W339_9ROSI|nr:hypothetical protein CMV_003267 [Castanea mollissima]
MALILTGDEVEVCSKQVCFVGSYYAATVINNYGNQSYVVHYKNLVSEDDESQPLIEIVFADEVRPMPHTVSATEFSLYDGLMLMIMMASGSARYLGSKTPITTMCSSTHMGLRFYIHSLA